MSVWVGGVMVRGHVCVRAVAPPHRCVCSFVWTWAATACHVCEKSAPLSAGVRGSDHVLTHLYLGFLDTIQRPPVDHGAPGPEHGNPPSAGLCPSRDDPDDNGPPKVAGGGGGLSTAWPNTTALCSPSG